ncbi:hypothetical protein H4CHR_00952 [Variovorax sp. PBS-H4]|uniref:DUF1365 domain-containing protein n=1 Tax=Variovorax sp. PBS-H4 TaxID=434008 RepID=UPI001316C345|nr:DUF1365 family protein [Variovorax sp. PBS-H4]VTU22256.1 hypothetical protein H4CHR_00952 [Variovorax sp. PBS-H4]
MSEHSALYSGSVVHRRLRPVVHRLRYRVFSLLLDLDELPQLAHRLRFFSLDRFNLFSLHQRDHGAGGDQGLRPYVEHQLQAAGLVAGGAIRLLAMPRILGYAFNPLSVYFCHHPDGGLQAILYEVNSTFGERHSYLIAVDEAQRPAGELTQHCAKRFHVSPFLALDMHYRFGIAAPQEDDERLRIAITASDGEGPVLTACFDARRRTLDDRQLLRAFVACPLLTLKVITAIHWEALRLWTKGLRLHRRPAAPERAVTVVNDKHP